MKGAVILLFYSEIVITTLPDSGSVLNVLFSAEDGKQSLMHINYVICHRTPLQPSMSCSLILMKYLICHLIFIYLSIF